MKIYEVEDRTLALKQKLLEVWENSVMATHLFLSSKEIENIKKYVHYALEEVKHLIVLENDENTPIAFMGIENGKLEMLFIKDSERRKGLGKQLLSYGMENYDINELTVNEQNYNARKFYEHMGFKVYT